MTDDAATCAQVAAGTAPVLSIVNYSDKKGVINKADPNLAVYWVKVTVAAGSAHGARSTSRSRRATSPRS